MAEKRKTFGVSDVEHAPESENKRTEPPMNYYLQKAEHVLVLRHFLIILF